MINVVTLRKRTRKKEQKEKEKERKTDRYKKVNKSYSERVKAKWFGCAFKLGLLQLISTTSLNFKSNLEFALSIILK